MGRHVDSLLDDLGISLDKNSESYQMLCYDTLKAKIMVLEADKRKLLADFLTNFLIEEFPYHF
jgi:hypothetical protein